jgi:hypothetical protein
MKSDIQSRNISEIKANPKNPRIIRDEKFAKLVQSIKDFPQMLQKRPLVCFTDTDGKFVVLGGNMRLKAAKEAGMQTLPVILADDWTEEQKAEFLIKDNVGFGEWDWEQLANEWDSEKLDEWGLDVPNYSIGLDVNNMTEEDIDTDENFDPIGTSKGLHKIIFIFDNEDKAIKWYADNNIKSDYKKFGGSDVSVWHVNLSTKYAK